MSLNVHVYSTDETGEPTYHEPEEPWMDMAGFEVCRTRLYGCALASARGLTLLPGLAHGYLDLSAEEVPNLLAEADIILADSEAFGEASGFGAYYVERRVGNIRSACLRALSLGANVVIW